MIRLVRVISLSSIFLVASVSIGNCQERLEGVARQLRSRCTAKPTPPTSTNTFLLQQLNLSPTLIELPSGNSTLGALLAKNELTALAISNLQDSRPTLSEGENFPQFLESYLDIRLRSFAPRFTMLVRGNTATIFPSSFVVASQVRNCVIKDGDIVGTFREAPTWISHSTETKTQIDQPISEFFKLTFQRSVEQSTKGNIDVFGIVVPSSLSKNESLVKEFSAITRVVPPSFDLNSESALENQLISELPDIQIRIADKMAVCVLHRKVQGFNVQFVFPLKTLGSFSANGFLFKSLILDAAIREDKSQMEKEWRSAYEKNGDIILLDGDRIEITTIEFVPLFNPLLNQGL